MAEAVTFKKVIVNHTGACEGFNYYAGQPVKLPHKVLQAIGSENYKEESEDAPQKEEKPQQSKKESKPQAKVAPQKEEKPQAPADEAAKTDEQGDQTPSAQ